MQKKAAKTTVKSNQFALLIHQSALLSLLDLDGNYAPDADDDS
ncbi:hypothetical protein [Janthinobacterium sp. PSPC3-1]